MRSQFTPLLTKTAALLVALVLSCAAAADVQMSSVTYKKLEKARVLMDEKQDEAALELLTDYSRRVKKKPVDSAIVHQYMANLLVQLDRIDEAASVIGAAYQQPRMPERLGILYGKLLVMQENYNEAEKVLAHRIGLKEKVPAEAVYTLAFTRFHLEEFAKAEAGMLKAMEMVEIIPRSWYELLLALYYQQEKFEDAEKLAVLLVKKEPLDGESWRRLARIYLERSKYSQALASLMSAHHRGLLDHRDIKQIASLHGHLDMPENAARMLAIWLKEEEQIAAQRRKEQAGQQPKQSADPKEKRKTAAELAEEKRERELNLLRQLGNYWLLARDRQMAKQVFGQAEQKDDTGRTALMLGNLYFDDEQWREAVQAFNTALDKGGLKDTDNTRLLLGVCYFQQKEYAKATTQFDLLKRSKKQASAAAYWKNQIRKTKEREKASS